MKIKSIKLLIFSLIISIIPQNSYALVTELLSNSKLMERSEYPLRPTPPYEKIDLAKQDISEIAKNSLSNTKEYVWHKTKDAFSPSRRLVNAKNISKAITLEISYKLEYIIKQYTHAYAKKYTFEAYDKGISKLPKNVQIVYKNATDKIDNAINIVLEKFKIKEKPSSQKTFIDKAKEFIQDKSVNYIKEVIKYFCVKSLRNAINSKLSTERTKKLAVESITNPFTEILDHPCLALDSIQSFAIDLKSKFFDDNLSDEERLQQFEEYIKFMEELDPEQAQELKKQLDEAKKIKEKVIKGENSPLRKIAEFVFEIVWSTTTQEAGKRTLNFANKKLGYDKESIQDTIDKDPSKVSDISSNLLLKYYKKFTKEQRNKVVEQLTQGENRINPGILKTIVATELKEYVKLQNSDTNLDGTLAEPNMLATLESLLNNGTNEQKAIFLKDFHQKLLDSHKDLKDKHDNVMDILGKVDTKLTQDHPKSEKFIKNIKNNIQFIYEENEASERDKKIKFLIDRAKAKNKNNS